MHTASPALAQSRVRFYGIKRCIYGDEVGKKPITCLTPGPIDEGRARGCGKGGKASEGKLMAREEPAVAMGVPLGGEAPAMVVVAPLSASGDEHVLVKVGAPAA